LRTAFPLAGFVTVIVIGVSFIEIKRLMTQVAGVILRVEEVHTFESGQSATDAES
jgi:hypothetical protein